MRWSRRAPIGEQPWEKWFAWHPVQCGDVFNEWVWLEWVERQKRYEFEHTNRYWWYKHRTIDNPNVRT